MDLDQIAFCECRILEEEMLGLTARSPDDATAHAQAALLYKAQLRALLRMQPALHASEQLTDQRLSQSSGLPAQSLVRLNPLRMTGTSSSSEDAVALGILPMIV